MDTRASSDYVPPYSVEDSLFWDYRLPNELWCKIWSHFPLDSRVVVPRVCRKWRVVSFAEPQLWSTLRIASPRPRHAREQFELNYGEESASDNDGVDHDMPDSYSTNATDGADRDWALSNDISDHKMADDYVCYVPGIPMISITNPMHLSRMLVRLPDVSLTLFIVIYRTVPKRFLRDVSAVIRQHSRRVEHLKLFLVHPTFVRFLPMLQPLPNLLSLEIYSPYDAEHADERGYNRCWYDEDQGTRNVGRLVLGHETAMPRLEHLRTSAMFCLENTQPIIDQPFGSLRSLSVTVTAFHCVSPALCACPQLERLRVHLENFDHGEPSADLSAIDTDTLAVASRLTAVHISGLLSLYQPMFLELFRLPTRQSFILEYWPAGDFSKWPPRRIIPNIFTDVYKPTYLRFYLAACRIAVECGNDLGQTRILTLPDGVDERDYAISLARQINPRWLQSVHCPMDLHAELLVGMEPGMAEDVDMCWALFEASESEDIPDDAHTALTANFDERSLAWELEPSAEMLNAALVSSQVLGGMVSEDMDT
ncbi:hypothetical protein AURDEDRAFT_131055 [Auricularia subglabra TFB-10046 SS5]|nr:hypothetical protein AURDEDRAFT_131055 [Auricularia subglabra TFB-10046 SS5]